MLMLDTNTRFKKINAQVRRESLTLPGPWTVTLLSPVSASLAPADGTSLKLCVTMMPLVRVHPTSNLAHHTRWSPGDWLHCSR